MREKSPLDSILRQLEAKLGEIVASEILCPGVCYISAEGTEYYAVKERFSDG